MENLINLGIILTYLMIAIAAITAIGFGVKKIISNKENTKKTLYTLGGLAIILLFSYILASNQVLSSFEKYNITESISKQVGMGLITFYLLLLGAIGTIIYSELSKLFSK